MRVHFTFDSLKEGEQWGLVLGRDSHAHQAEPYRIESSRVESSDTRFALANKFMQLIAV